jgi:hypothetical protein
MFFPSYSGSAKYEVGRAVVANRISAITRLSFTSQAHLTCVELEMLNQFT